VVLRHQAGGHSGQVRALPRGEERRVEPVEEGEDEGRETLVPSRRGRDPAVEADDVDRPGGRLGGAQVGERRLHLRALPPDAVEAECGGILQRPAAAQRRRHVAAVEEPRLPGQRVEAHLLVQEADQPRLGEKGRAVAVRGLAELHDAGVADRGRERHEVREVLVGRVDRAHRDGVGA
jgi:hypothetical protein